MKSTICQFPKDKITLTFFFEPLIAQKVLYKDFIVFPFCVANTYYLKKQILGNYRCCLAQFINLKTKLDLSSGHRRFILSKYVLDIYLCHELFWDL